MRIYVDFDDVISETARTLCGLADRLYGRKIRYEDVFAFDLKTSFGLSRSEIDALMDVAHSHEYLLAYPETPGAAATLSAWRGRGLDIEIVTGRPAFTQAGTREWLDLRGLGDIPVIHVDKFGREPPPSSPDAPRAMDVDTFCRRRYDFAVEDSPTGLLHLARIPGCRVAVYERPWNAKVPLPSPAFTCCANWQEIDELLQSLP